MSNNQTVTQGTWKLILGTHSRQSRNPKDGTESTKHLTSIITSDSRQLILSEYETVSDPTELTQKQIDALVEIDGIYYKQFGQNSYHPNSYYAIKTYLEDKKILNPKKDITKMQDVIEMYDELLSEAKEIFGLDILKKHKK